MKFRPRRGSLADELLEVVDIDPTTAALAEVLEVKPRMVRVLKDLYDYRIRWDTHMVCVGSEPRGYCDGPVLHTVLDVITCAECGDTLYVGLGHDAHRVIPFSRCRSCNYHSNKPKSQAR